MEINQELIHLNKKFDKLPILKSSRMNEDYEIKRRKQVAGVRSTMNYAVGALIVFAGLFLFFRNNFDLRINETFPPDYLDKLFGALCALYGGWRIYRGYKKDYFK